MKEIKILALLVLVSLISTVSAEKPINVNPLNVMQPQSYMLTVYQPTPPPTGGTCNTLYAERNSYCSVNIRMYEQCIPTSDTEGKWQIRSENCGNYDYICFAGDCVAPSWLIYFIVYGIPIIVIAGIVYFWKVRK